MASSPAQKNKYNNFGIILNDNFNLVIIAIVILLLFASYFLIIKPKFNSTLVAVKTNIDQQELFYQNQRQKLIDLQAAVELYGKIGADNIDKINQILPDEYAKERLFGELEDILSQRGLMLDSLQLSKSGEDNDEPLAPRDAELPVMPSYQNIGTIKAEMSLSSIDYVALKNLLPLLEKQLQLIDVEELNFDPAAKTAHLIFYTYFFK